MRTPKLIPFALALVLAAPAAYAAPPAAKETPKQPQRFAEMDADRDGKITRAEWKGDSIGFSMQDANSDGVLSGAELAPPAAEAGGQPAAAPSRDDKGRRERVFKSLDKNGDGRLTRAEWSNDKFDRLDRDRNGVLTKAEFSQR